MLILVGPPFVGKTTGETIIVKRFQNTFALLGQVVGQPTLDNQIYNTYVNPSYFEIHSDLFLHWEIDFDGIKRGILNDTLREIIERPDPLCPVTSMPIQRALNTKNKLTTKVLLLYVEALHGISIQVIERDIDEAMRPKYLEQINNERAYKEHCDFFVENNGDLEEFEKNLATAIIAHY